MQDFFTPSPRSASITRTLTTTKQYITKKNITT